MSKDDKALNRAELELTQRMQVHFPVGVFSPEVLAQWNSCPKEVLTRALQGMVEAGPVEVVQNQSLLLHLVSTVYVSAHAEQFVAKTAFVLNTKRRAPVKISYLGDNFISWFLRDEGKTENPPRLTDGQVAEQTLRYHTLQRSSVDTPIIAELGGEGKVETTLTELFSLMQKQKHGGKGSLLINGWANIFYIRDINGVLRAVSVSWDGGGWGVSAVSREGPIAWRGGRRVFSRNS